ncbi:MAG: ABC transporter permease [Veillonellales bacterium]
MGDKRSSHKFCIPANDSRQGLFLPVLLLLLWQMVSSSGAVNPLLFPSPVSIFKTGAELIADGELPAHLQVSILRVGEGFMIAAALALLLGTAMGLAARIFSLLNLTLQLLRPIPPIAWIPLAILWFGIEESSKVFIIALGSFFPILTNVLSGVRQTETKYVELARVLQIPQKKFIMKVLLQGAVPYVVTGLRTGLGYGWMCVVAAELSAGMQGIGYMLIDARATLQTDKVIVGMLAIGIIGKLMDSFLLVLEGKLLKGKEFFTGNDR